MPINPLPSDRSVGKGRFVKWQAPKKKWTRTLERSRLQLPSTMPLVLKRGGGYGEFCLRADAKPSGQAGNRRAKQADSEGEREGEAEGEEGGRQAWGNHENECKWRWGQPREEHGEGFENDEMIKLVRVKEQLKLPQQRETHWGLSLPDWRVEYHIWNL